MPPRKRATQEVSEVTSVEEIETSSSRSYKDLSPTALGISEANFEDFEGELPKQSAANEKYKVYYEQLMDSYDRGVAKRVEGVDNPKDLVNALRNAASNNGIGIDTRIVDGVVFFKGREKRPKRANSAA